MKITEHVFDHAAVVCSSRGFVTLWNQYFGEISQEIFQTLAKLSFTRVSGMYCSSNIKLSTKTNNSLDSEWRCRSIGSIAKASKELAKTQDPYLTSAFDRVNLAPYSSDKRNRIYIDHDAGIIFSYNKNAMSVMSILLDRMREELILGFYSNLETETYTDFITEAVCDAYKLFKQRTTPLPDSFLAELRSVIHTIAPTSGKFRAFEIVRLGLTSVEIRFVPTFLGVRDIANELRGRSISGLTLVGTRIIHKTIVVDVKSLTD
ncbi:MAG: hypothetical protein ACRC6V_03975 [Bacteroidales bacterium]